MLYYLCLSLRSGITGLVPFTWVSHGRRSIFFSKGGLTCCQGGRHFDLLWGRAINPSKTYLFPHSFSSISRFHAILKVTCVWVCEIGSPAWFHFLELATVGGPFFISKEGLTCCQGGRHFDLLWGRAINPSKNILVRQHNKKMTPKEVKKAEIKSETLRLHTVGCRAPRAKRRTDL
jgi:hypothetical protein